MNLPWKSTSEVREIFLNYFLKNDHMLIAPSGVLPRNDPTLLFINSGMAPLKPFFTGASTPPHPRLTNIQDCIRFTDIEDVGDQHHGTSFRMMGSWSFGDYFKELAVEYAFALITDTFGFPAEHLYATVFKSDATLPEVPDDTETALIWEKFLPRDRIIFSPPEDNFWGPAGISGPCGPCTEIFFDRFGDTEEPTPGVLVPGRHIEIWNAGVFMQYYKDESGVFSLLPINCVDTGAGLERFSMLLQDKPSIHEIDQYEGVYQLVYDNIGDTRWSRTILDHLKTSLLIMREGVSPSNQREGYLVRRLLRRSMFGAVLNEQQSEFIDTVFNALCEVVDDQPKTDLARDSMNYFLKVERGSFDKLMGRSRKYLDEIVQTGSVTAQEAFDLKTSQGMPEELIEEYCVRHSIEFPRSEFLELLERHKQISRQKKS